MVLKLKILLDKDTSDGGRYEMLFSEDLNVSNWDNLNCKAFVSELDIFLNLSRVSFDFD